MELPSISLITSWSDEKTPEETRDAVLPHSILQPLLEGIDELDLYLISHSEISWFANAAGIDSYRRSPTQFMAALETGHIQKITKKLNAGMAKQGDKCRTGVFGFWPRIRGIATFFPDISHPVNDERYRDAVKAVKNACELAHNLGASVVEIVGGAGVPEIDSADVGPNYVDRRRAAFVNALCDIYIALGDRVKHDVKLALEIEPGEAFLLSSLEEYKKLLALLQARIEENSVESEVANFVTLNVDIAHAFICGIDESQLSGLTIGHMHISDHASHRRMGGIHASDLALGKFHFYDDYRPFLKLALKLTNLDRSAFSGTIAVELEAANDLDRAHATINTAKRWLRDVKETSTKI